MEDFSAPLRNPFASLFAAIKLQVFHVQYWRLFPRLPSPDPHPELRLPSDPSSDKANARMELGPVYSNASEPTLSLRQAILYLLPDAVGVWSCSTRLTCALCVLALVLFYMLCVFRSRRRPANGAKGRELPGPRGLPLLGCVQLYLLPYSCTYEYFADYVSLNTKSF